MTRHANEPVAMPATQKIPRATRITTIKLPERLHCVLLKYRHCCERITKFEDHPTLLTK